jgi:hypothetical protein
LYAATSQATTRSFRRLKSTLREPELRGLSGSSGSASAASSSNCRFAIRRRQSSSVAKASKNYHKLYLFLALIGVERQSTALRIVLHAHCITPASFAEATSVLEISGPQAEVVFTFVSPPAPEHDEDLEVDVRVERRCCHGGSINLYQPIPPIKTIPKTP